MKIVMKKCKASATTMRHFLFTCILLLCSATVLLAQAGRGSISGLVTDPTGAIVPGAKITLLNQATGTTQHSVTTAGGLYSFVSLNPGVYVVTASMKGFESVALDKVTVSVDQTTTANITLRIGSVNEVVTVTEGTSLVETSNSTVGQLISAETIDRVPLLTRNVFDLVQLSPGVTPANGTPNSSTAQSISSITSGRPGVDVSSYTINGAIQGSVYYMLDGSPLGIAENNAAAIMPAIEIPEDGVDETRVETQNTPASYQSGGAGVISLVSKSGGNKFHGDAFGVFRPNAMAANEYFNKQYGHPTPDYHRYQEGGAISGPILRNKLFFFGDYEDTQEQHYDGSNWFTVPTSAERTGNFSADSFAIYDPTLPDNPDGTRQAFANNTITNPNPIALKFLSEFPKCNVGASCDTATDGAANNLFVPGVDPTKAHKFDVRIDWAKSEKQRIFGRFSFVKSFTSLVNAITPPADAFNKVPMWDPFYAQNVTKSSNTLLADDITLSPTTVLQLRYSFTRHYEVQSGAPQQDGYDITNLGFPSALAAEEVYKTLPYVMFNDVGGGIGGTANWNTFTPASENSDANGTLTKSWGKNTVSAGGEYMKRFMNVGQPPASSGAYYFDYSATDQSVASGVGGSDFASFLVGMGTAPGSESYNFTKDLFVAESNPYYSVFAEDTYHASHALTITLGLRWDIFGGRTERHNRLEYFNPKATNTVSGVSYTGAEVYVTGSNRSPFTTNMKNFGPRLGVSWQPASHLVVRGGGGIYYGPSAEMVGSGALNSDGYSTVTNWNSTCNNSNGNTIFNVSVGCPGQVGAGNDENFTGPYSLSNPFPNGVVPVISSPRGLGNNLGTTLNTMMHSQSTTTTYNFNFGLEYELPHAIVLSAGYVGSRGLFLPMGQVDLNMLDLATIAKYQGALCAYGESNCQMVTNTWEAIQPATNANIGQSQVPLWVSLQPYPQFGDGSYGDGNGVLAHGYPAGDSEYSSLQTKLQKRLTQHFTALVAFTWAKLMTDDGNPPLGFVGSHGGAAQDTRNLNLEHSVSPQDVKYQFNAQASYDLPMGKGRAMNLSGTANAILGGWTVNGIAYLSTGIPVASPTSGTPNGYFNQRANMVCDPNKGAPHTATEWFSDACFTVPGVAAGSTDLSTANRFVPGTAPAYLDHVRTMGAQDVDLSLHKNFKLGNEKNLRLEVSSYNVTNKAQLGMPAVPSITDVINGQATTPFGQILSTVNTPRQFQFGSRFTF
jgi:hypothetical protein